MTRACVRIGGGGGNLEHAVEHPYFLKKMPGNPYIGAQHDSKSTEYNKGFVSKPMHWLYRFRYNSLPVGMPTGFFCRNPQGKNVHWLEVSTIEKMRVQMMGEEAFAPGFVSAATVIFTIYHCYRYTMYHPDLTLYNMALWTSKPFVTMYRNSQKHRMDQPSFRYVDRAPEFYAYDPIRELYGMGLAANDPFVKRVKDAGREDELYMHVKDYTSTKPNLREIFAHDGKPRPPPTF